MVKGKKEKTGMISATINKIGEPLTNPIYIIDPELSEAGIRFGVRKDDIIVSVFFDRNTLLEWNDKYAT